MLSRLDASRAPAIAEVIETHALERAAAAMRKRDANAARFELGYERAMFDSLARFGLHADGSEFLARLGALLRVPPAPRATGPIYRRNMNVKGPMAVFGYDYFADHYAQAKDMKLKDDYAYEALNLADGRRTTSEIRDALAAIYGPVPLEDVEQYLAAAESIGIVNRVTAGQP